MKPARALSDLTRRFEARTVDAAAFRHAEHVRVAYDLLANYAFLDATTLYATGIRRLAEMAGAPQKFNMTITCAFLSLIAERMARDDGGSCEEFLARNPDLLSKDLLAHWYAPDRLHSEIARTVFLMPAPATGVE